VVSSSSTKRAARLAKKGKGKRVRFQGGTLFPIIILAIAVIGLGTIVYARQSQPEADASPPTIEDHWHAAYGFSLCDEEGFTQLAGAKEETDANGQLISSEFLRTGVHSHDDGVIHWHPYTAAAVGKRATLGVFLDVYGVELTDDSLKFPDEQGGKEYVEGETQCDGEDGELKVIVWDDYDDPGAGTTYVSNFNDIRVDSNSMVFSISFQPQGTEVGKPDWAAQLPELGAVDDSSPVPTSISGSVPPGETLPPGATIAPSQTVPPGGSLNPTQNTTEAPSGTTVAPSSNSPPTTG